MYSGHVLIAVPSVADRTGLEVWTLEVAGQLIRRGWAVTIYAPTLGTLSDEVRELGVVVVSDVRDARQPDIIHGTFFFEAIAACEVFPQVPMIYPPHAAAIWMALPPRHPSLRAILSVDDACTEAIRKSGFEDADITSTLNFADTDRFVPRESLPERPQRALVFSNYATLDGYPAILRQKCAAVGIALEVVGACAGSVSHAPQEMLSNYDLVFAKGRCAIEALAVGCAVIPCDRQGVGPLVTPSSYDGLRRRNFGWSTLTEVHGSNFVDQQIAAYDHRLAAEVSARIRREASLKEAINLLEVIYRNAMAASAVSNMWTREALITDILQRLAPEFANADRRYDPTTRAAMTIPALLGARPDHQAAGKS